MGAVVGKGLRKQQTTPRLQSPQTQRSAQIVPGVNGPDSPCATAEAAALCAWSALHTVDSSFRRKFIAMLTRFTHSEG